MMGCPLASTVVKAMKGGVDDRLEMTDSGTMVRIALCVPVATSATPVMVEPAALVAVTSFAVPKSSVVDDPRTLSPTDPT